MERLGRLSIDHRRPQGIPGGKIDPTAVVIHDQGDPNGPPDSGAFGDQRIERQPDSQIELAFQGCVIDDARGSRQAGASAWIQVGDPVVLDRAIRVVDASGADESNPSLVTKACDLNDQRRSALSAKFQSTADRDGPLTFRFAPGRHGDGDLDDHHEDHEDREHAARQE